MKTFRQRLANDIFARAPLIYGVVFAIVFAIYGSLLLVQPAHATSLSEQYAADRALPVGALVSILPGGTHKATLAKQSNSNQLLGVVVDDASVAVNFEIDGNSSSVASSGEVRALVSNLNGDVKSGDLVTVSWLDGVGMKSQIGDGGRVIGIALENYSAGEAKLYGSVSTPDGEKSAYVDSVMIRIANENNAAPTAVSDAEQKGLFAKIAGKEVSVLRIIAAVLIFLVSLGLAGMFIYSAIRNAFVSIGRNPLSKGAIIRSLMYVSLISVAVVAVGAALSYVVLVA